MTAEQKAKAYDEALKVLHKYDGANIMFTQDLKEEMFPELKESDDERIRKGLIKYFRAGKCGNVSSYHGISTNDILDWLEKQGEQKTADMVIEDEKPLLEKFKQAVYDCAWGKVTCKKEGETKEEYAERWAEQFLLIVRDWADDYVDFTIQQKLRNSYEKGKADIIEKQDEQKPDTVEPKFKVGDWVVYTGYLLKDSGKEIYVMQVASIEDDRYNFTDTSTLCFDSEKDMRSWTIQDAKDGDVLHSTGFDSDCVFIFNGLDNWKFDESNNDRAVATGYCGLFVSADNMEFGIQGPDCVEVNTIKPSTKIQRDLLFQKMKEAGYEWDAEKKELKKIEQKSVDTVEPKFKAGDKVICLESFDGFIKGQIYTCREEGWIGCDKQGNWTCRLDKFKVVDLQSPAAWSEEDEDIINLILNICNDFKNSFSGHVSAAVEDDIKKIEKWLKSLRPQSRWKPSDEQIECLSDAIKHYNLLGYPAFKLKELLDDLKKLTEE